MHASQPSVVSRLSHFSRFFLAMILFGLVAPRTSLAEAEVTDNAEPSGKQDKVAFLISELGAHRFAERERATNELSAMGPEILAPIQIALQHDDAEIRRRAKQIYRSVNEAIRENLLEQFLRHPEIGTYEDTELPGWERLQASVGDSPESRTMLVAMLRDHWDTIESFESGNNIASDFIRKLKDQSRVRRDLLTVQGVATAVLMAQDPRQDAPTQEMATLLGLLHQVSGNRSAQFSYGGDPWKQQPFRDLVSGLLVHCTEPTAAWQTFSLALRHNLDAAVEPALQVIKNRNCRPHVRQYALLTIAKFGTKDNVERVKPLLDDTNVCYRREDPRTKKAQFECQVRDVAFATMLHLTAKDPRQFGFAQAKANSYSVYQPSTLGFANDEERAVAYKKWETASGEKLPRVKNDEGQTDQPSREPAATKTQAQG